MYISLQREFDLFDLQWNVHRIFAPELDLRTSAADPMVAFWDVY